MRFLFLPASIVVSFGLFAACVAKAERSPVNQVFQYSVSGVNESWGKEMAKKAVLHLWIPEKCERLRGLLIFGANVPEHMLVGHPAIRRACAKNNLGIVWAVPSFWNFSKITKGRDDLQVAFLERLLQQLADKSGYSEVASVPWLSIGESAHLLMVGGLLTERPERCIAAICVKNPGPKSDAVPILWTLGTGQEWRQKETDIREAWTNVESYEGWVKNRAKGNAPLSIIVEPGTGHFYCSEEMAVYFADYIAVACKARLPDDAGGELRPVQISSGVFASLPIPGQSSPWIVPAAKAAPEEANAAWFFDAKLARDAQRLSSADWNAAPQLVGFVAGEGSGVDSFAFNSVTKITIRCDGEFEVGTELLDSIPDGFVGAGEPLSRAVGSPTLEWICGPYEKISPSRFRIALDRTWGHGAAYLIAQHEGDKSARRTVQPAHLTFEKNTEGKPQRITFEPIPDVVEGTPSIPLVAHSDSGLPVDFFVSHGPAKVESDYLVFTEIPPRSRFPIEVSVSAWQWGRHSEPQVQTAPVVTQRFHIVQP